MWQLSNIGEEKQRRKCVSADGRIMVSYAKVTKSHRFTKMFTVSNHHKFLLASLIF